MENSVLNFNGTEIKCSFLKDNNGNWLHFFYTVVPEKPEQIADQIKTIEQAEVKLLEKFKIENKYAVVKRFFSGDLINHHDEIMNFKKRQNTDFFMSLTEQPPIPSVKVVLLGMCLNNVTKKHRDGKIFYFDTTSGLRHIFAEHLLDPDSDEHSNSAEQTRKIFRELEEKLSVLNASIENNVLRTWLYAPHVDADYPGIVKARKELFDSINLTKDTHYIASTGIQGGTGNRFARVFMDAYAVIGIDKEKIRYINDPEYLSPTEIYGVTFERATAIEMGDVNYLFISGTASIDKVGEVVHPGDIVKQTERTLVNISALLRAAKFSEKDLSSFIVYLRDPADYSFVKPKIDEYCENLPAIYVKAPVCRPGWLIEIEATAEKMASRDT
ncbi:MAG: hypothetical protein A2X59_11155 [Nitrospirae bacterium GWC2_42_7]|nr:MAG: hypothetical protein A2X59_11155 [Nitrospirae bacterium GWC2_42_7]